MKVSDFNLARKIYNDELASVAIGNEIHMSPEAGKGKYYPYGSDGWGLGIIVIELMVIL